CFFFQAEDGIRDGHVTGVQTCALPIFVSASAPLKPGEGALRLSDVEVNVDPRAEWKQIYHDVWRIERSYFYDPNLHGLNAADSRSEERRVGKEWRSGGWRWERKQKRRT